MKLNEFVNQRRKELNMSVDELVKKSGIPKGTLSKITAGINSNPTLSTVESLCKALNCSLNDIAGNVQVDAFSLSEKNHIIKYRELDTHGKKMVDIVLDEEYERCISAAEESEGEKPEIIEIKIAELPASAGTGVDLCEENYQIMSIRASDLARQADFAVRVSGDSMETTFYDGDILLIESMPFINKGDIGIFVLNGDGYVKEYGGDRLISHNKKYPDIRLTEHDVVICSGRVIGVLEEDDFIN